jgi:hypothetical protein
MKWQIFSLLEPDFVYKIKMACVYGMYYVTFFCKQSTGSWIRKSEYTLLLAGYLIIPCFHSEKAHFWL